MKILQIVSFSEDERGLFSCLLNKGLHRFADLNYAETKKGQNRGNHYHKFTNELFIVLSGKIELVVEKIENDRIVKSEKHVFSKYDMFEIEPYENHTIHVIEEARWISLLTESFTEENKDFHRIPV